MFIKTSILLSLVLFMLSTAQISSAEIYKYKDKNGRWIYTDKKPVGTQGVEHIESQDSRISTTSQNRDDWVKLEELLTGKFQPQNPAQIASLAVVSVTTETGSGSGFFVSDSGHIITNRHVIRPKTSTGWKEQDEKLKIEERNITHRTDALERAKRSLSSDKLRLDKMHDSILHPTKYSNPLSAEEYDVQEKEYKARERDYLKVYRETQQISADFKRRQQDFSFNSNIASLSRNFEVYLKDGTKVQARLVRVAKVHDLALLKIDGYTTPFLKASDTAIPSQTQMVFAIGSPLGNHDSITQGRVTGMQGRNILVDATVLPGSSGGPLVDNAGDLLGVNTLRIIDRRFNGANGFGVAIPVSAVFDEFGKIISTAKDSK